ncbi:ankyrin repeat ph and sec7 domain containing protein secg-related [Anaeramoeba flamelloides]|uniref:Ankyrin repeat ph and sec7 domain containing protein secg-related n=1 Tax=Anaeramoeba flamelloides TaxID=1746091 RepID=A0AAV7YMX7_9EUKA|nr:ankyrin repeat ph and sec7 domain containing protein secg-related [Anaeramoeba flamelloides]
MDFRRYQSKDRHKRLQQAFIYGFPDNVNKRNVNDKCMMYRTQPIHFLLECAEPKLKDLEYLCSLGSDLHNRGGLVRSSPLKMLVLRHTHLRKDLIYCLFDHCFAKNSLSFGLVLFHLEEIFFQIKNQQRFKLLFDFLKIVLVYLFERKGKINQKEITNEKNLNLKKVKQEKEKEKEKEQEKEKEKEKEKEEEKEEEEKKKEEKKLTTINFILDCLKNKEDLTKCKELINNNKIDLQYQEKNTRCNLIHALILSDRADNLALKLEIIQQIIQHNQNNTKAILNQKINWINFTELHLISMLHNNVRKQGFPLQLTKLFLANGSDLNLVDDCQCSGNNSDLNSDIEKKSIFSKSQRRISESTSCGNPLYLHLQQKTINEEIVKYHLENESNVLLYEPKPNNRSEQSSFSESMFRKKSAFELLCSHECNSLEIFKMFFKAGVNLKDYQGSVDQRRIINLVCSRGNPTLEIIRFLIESGERIVSGKLETQTIYYIVFNHKCQEKYEIIKYFNEIGAGFKIDCSSKQNIVHFMCSRSNFPKFEQALFLILNIVKKYNWNLNSSDRVGYTPLHLMMEFYNSISVPFLKKIVNEHGGDLEAIEKDGCSPLHYYFKQKNFDPQIVDFCVGKIKNKKLLQTVLKDNLNIINFICRYQTPLIDKIKYIAKNYTVDFDLASEIRKETPLHLICRSSVLCKEIIVFLIENGCDINRINIENKTPLNFLFRKWVDLFE